MMAQDIVHPMIVMSDYILLLALHVKGKKQRRRSNPEDKARYTQHQSQNTFKA